MFIQHSQFYFVYRFFKEVTKSFVLTKWKATCLGDKIYSTTRDLKLLDACKKICCKVRLMNIQYTCKAYLHNQFSIRNITIDHIGPNTEKKLSYLRLR